MCDPKDSSFWHFGQAFSCFGRECPCSMGAFGSKHNAATTCKTYSYLHLHWGARHFAKTVPTAGDCDALVAQRPSAKDLTDLSRGVTFRLGSLAMSHPRVGLANGEKLKSHASTLRGSTKKMGMCFFVKELKKKHSRFFCCSHEDHCNEVPMAPLDAWSPRYPDKTTCFLYPKYTLNGSYIP